MRRFQTFLALIVLCVQLFAQDRGPWNSLVSRLEAFGRTIPQEKVYVHMDNTCYFLGDTIWFKAYLRQTNNGTPSKLSGTLYAELINNEGYLVERKLIEMRDGEGDGFFYLQPEGIQYAGFYELRAYTRWQLNWGEYEHDNQALFGIRMENVFFNKAMRHEAYRDYEKLYSRVFPVYNKPFAPGEYNLDMTLHPHQRAFKDNIPKLSVSFYPEGGNLLEGVPNRVAFEVARTDGEGISALCSIDGKEVRTQHRGKGVLEVTPERGMERSITFVTDRGEVIKGKLPKADERGVDLQVRYSEGEWKFCTQVVNLEQDSLALTIMHEGRLQVFQPLQKGELRMQNKDLPCGVNQVTVFDTDGRIWADRLFFVKKAEAMAPTLTVSTPKYECEAYERIGVDVKSANQLGANVSISVRDVSHGARNYDTGNILTEMLLSSEVRGFIPEPEYYFESDDDEHNTALDLLLMTQGWRRFNWRDMAVKGEWEFVHPAEKTPILTGGVHKYISVPKCDPIRPMDSLTMASFSVDDSGRRYHQKDLKRNRYLDSLQVSANMRKKMMVDGEKLKREARVHGEFFNYDYENYVIGDVTTKDGQFRIVLPRFHGKCDFYLSASDTIRWRKKERTGKVPHLWVVADEEQYPEFYVRLSYPYPKYVKPYSYYQKHEVPLSIRPSDSIAMSSDTYLLREVTKKSRRRGLTSYSTAVPILGFDAYDAFNLGVDYGLIDAWYSSTGDITSTLAEYYINEPHNPKIIKTAYGDVLHGMFEGDEQFANNAPQEVAKYQYLYNLDSVYVYTDYEPRLEGDDRYWGAENLRFVVLYKLFPDGNIRRTYRDRFIRLQGYALPAEFYSPDYSQRPLPEVKDYRRTLYWNPNLRLDENGEAHITLYNNSRHTTLQVDAQGQAADGTLLYNR